MADISAGWDFTCALTTAGAVLCWGDNSLGQLGNGTQTLGSSTPLPVVGLSSGVVAITTGGDFSCALTSAGEVRCWGYNFSYRPVNGTITWVHLTPITVDGLPTTIRAISAADSGICALEASGGVLCWGSYFSGDPVAGPTPVRVDGLPPAVTQIATGRRFGCALSAAGAVFCWGDNAWGQLGDGSTTNSAHPVAVIGANAGVAAIAAASTHVCAQTSAGLALCWGDNREGEVGDGTFALRPKSAIVLREHGQGGLATNDWFLDLAPAVSKTIPRDQIPAFLLVASGAVSSKVVTVDADVQFRPEDVGRPIYIFAYAPSTLFGKGAKDGPSPCVLAQLSGSGGLQQVSASNLQSYASSVLSSRSQAVSLLSNVSANRVPGTTFCLGTGASAAQALSAGNHQCAATVPGDKVCPPLASMPANANGPGTLSGLWWNANESGWGIHFTQRRDIVFAAWFTYDGSGNPKWYVASNCTMAAGSTAAAGRCNGTLYEAAGSGFFGTTFNSSAVTASTVGALQVTFQDANAAVMTYSMNGQGRTVPITRQQFQSGSAVPPIDYTDLWWNPSESGWGLAVTQQFGVMFIAWFVYDSAGKPIWYAASNCAVSATQDGCTGVLYRATGPAFSTSFDSAQLRVFTAGTVTLTFSDTNNGTLRYTVDGVTSSKAITRQLF